MDNTLMYDTYRVTCTITVNNDTKERLLHPTVRVAGGRVEIPPKCISPGQNEEMVARKTAYTATGSYGTVSWLIEGKDRRIVIMWVAPFNFDSYDNWLAVGLTRKGVTDHAAGNLWYKQMYEGNSSRSLRFVKMKYEKKDETMKHEKDKTIIYKEDGIEISGTMSTGHQANVTIIVNSEHN